MSTTLSKFNPYVCCTEGCGKAAVQDHNGARIYCADHTFPLTTVEAVTAATRQAARRLAKECPDLNRRRLLTLY